VEREAVDLVCFFARHSIASRSGDNYEWWVEVVRESCEMERSWEVCIRIASVLLYGRMYEGGCWFLLLIDEAEAESEVGSRKSEERNTCA
jgi:hypothetical protein